MKNFNVVLALLLIGMLGCSDESLVGLDDASLDAEATAFAAKKAKMVPYKGTAEGLGFFDSNRTDCPEGTVPLAGEGSGKATHVGRVVTSFSHCSFFLVDPTNPNYVDGRATVIAANGDEIHSTYEGYVTGPNSLVQFETITGGTGRFENATGSTVMEGTFGETAEGIFWEVSFEGEISSVGSSE